MDFLKVIYGNVEKKNSFNNKHLYLRVADFLKFYEVLLCTYCRGLFCLQEAVIMVIFLRRCIKHSQH